MLNKSSDLIKIKAPTIKKLLKNAEYQRKYVTLQTEYISLRKRYIFLLNMISTFN